MKRGFLIFVIIAALVRAVAGSPGQIGLLFVKVRELQDQINVILHRIASLENSCALRS